VRIAGRSLAKRLAERLGRAARIVAGRDTRESGEWIESAFLEGARASGARVESAGVITTPGVAYLARALPADAGVVISASHNPFQDNGIKIFAPDGRKLDDVTERLIEADIYAEADGGPRASEVNSESRVSEENSESRASESKAASGPSEVDESVAGVDEGGAEVDESGAEEDARHSAALRARYLDYLCGEVAAGLSLDGLSVVVDCANGAASELAPALLARLGARVVATGDAPDGRNINRGCGSLYMDDLQRRVVEEGAHLGV